MSIRTALSAPMLTIFLAGCPMNINLGLGPDPAIPTSETPTTVEPNPVAKLCPEFRKMPPEAVAFLRRTAAVDPDGEGPKSARPVAGSEELWDYLSWLTTLDKKLEICRAAEQ